MDGLHLIRDKYRIAEIARLKLHKAIVDSVLDNRMEEIAKEFGMAMCLVSIVMDNAQKFVGSYGLKGWLDETKGTPLEWSFCANSVISGDPFVVEEASSHEQVKENPLVTQDGVACYAGVPLVTKNDYILGNLCLLDAEPRQFTEQEIQILKEYAVEVMNHLESRVASLN